MRISFPLTYEYQECYGCGGSLRMVDDLDPAAGVICTNCDCASNPPIVGLDTKVGGDLSPSRVKANAQA